MNTVRKLLKQFIIFYTVILAGAAGRGEGYSDTLPGKGLRNHSFKPMPQIYCLQGNFSICLTAGNHLQCFVELTLLRKGKGFSWGQRQKE